ncbi:MAG: DNA-directed RNA polymerase subunit alpha [Deltaproteobacteria bacterium RIFCSPLOWO2_02_FULL_47_10]|nr:MAG: DNA-directed RNA polymerase subunit alpha [Deltaproteobacteria bacterium RIFCSPLOWO2_02_FULL_47_10]
MHRNWRDLIKPRAIEIEKDTLTPTYGKFVIKPLERGYGVTLGNSLRRILLSSLQGAAIYAVKIDGVLHEFSTITGVREDVTNIILNLKELRLKLNEGERDVMRLDISGEREVKARDIKISSKIEILNPDLHVATLGSEGKLKMELYVKLGRGYVPAERNKEEGQPIGLVPIDSIFTPILKVNYNVTNARVGQITDYDRLAVEIWTDGSVKPEDAIAYAAKIFKEQLQIFINFEETPEPLEDEKSEDSPKLNPNLYRRVDELELSVRSANCLQNASIKFIGELCQRSEPEMLKTKNFGRKSLNEIKEILSSMGLLLGMKLDGFSVKDAEKFRPKEIE